ncbi:HK97 family phage prohead protease [Prevotella sp. P3-122]|uniref:HK97 family phage prohead protease n=1 Tax=Prevotella sp. P3-122 TaxID=2024223 RepID=UPI000B97BEEF|nr:HK97 family phage prohead protease [Prevotella sp. P3-122]OYP60425.1 peptidase [Prevotella sp. P3-122]
MAKRVRLTSDILNSYGSRVLTAGMDIEQYKRNPVLLYMHERGNVIGYLKDIEKSSGEVTAELVFDEASELSRRCKKQWEVGSLRMVSVGIDILETSRSKAVTLEGQTRETVTRSKLYEVSLVDIGSNDDAIRLMRDGKQITLGSAVECGLPLINNPKKEKEMETKTIALLLGLPETASESELTTAISGLMSMKKENAELKQRLSKLEEAGIEHAVDAAIADKRIELSKREEFVELGKKIGAGDLVKLFASMSPRTKLSDMLDGGQPCGPVTCEYKKLSEVPSEKLAELKEKEPERYRRLYKAEYGMDM